MRGRIPYVTIVGYISPTFLKILVDHAISLFLNCMPISFFAALFRLFYNNDNREKVRPGNEAMCRLLQPLNEQKVGNDRPRLLLKRIYTKSSKSIELMGSA